MMPEKLNFKHAGYAMPTWSPPLGPQPKRRQTTPELVSYATDFQSTNTHQTLDRRNGWLLELAGL